MMGILRLANRRLKPRQLHAVLTKFAVHMGVSVHRFLGAILENLDEKRMRVQIIGDQELRLWMFGSELSRQLPDTFFQATSKEKEREYQNARKSQALTTR
jgi:hypothetical protein